MEFWPLNKARKSNFNNRLFFGLMSIFIGQLSVVAQTPKDVAAVVETEFKHKGGQISSLAEVVVEAGDGGKLLLTPDGQLWPCQPEDIVRCEAVEKTLKPLSGDEVYENLKEQLSTEFHIHKTAHYVLVYNTSETYARWVGSLYERLYRAFYNYWKTRGIRLEEPRFALVAIVFNTQQSYLGFAEREIGESARAMLGYYNLQTNRVVSFDLTGVEGLTQPGSRLNSTVLINQVLSQPQAERTVATIVHEAVHQLSYNSGLQTRLADNPLWVSEGMATFFETPDVKSSTGWGTIGSINYHNLQLFAKYLHNRPADSLTTLITDDSRFQNSDTAGNAYSESWALTYYLLKTKKTEYSDYLKALSQLKPLAEMEPRERVELFKQHFGADLQEFDKDFIAFARRLR